MRSDRWLDLPSNRERVCYVALLLSVDDFGNMEGTSSRLVSALGPYLEGDTAISVVAELERADLVRTYHIDSKRYVHIPRFQQSLRQPKRLNPASPWDPGTKHAEVKGSEFEVKGSELHLARSDATHRLQAAASPVGVFITVPLNDGTDFAIPPGLVTEWESLYPLCDVAQTLREIRGWAIANPTKRKTRTGVLRHVNAWLAREQNRG